MRVSAYSWKRFPNGRLTLWGPRYHAMPDHPGSPLCVTLFEGVAVGRAPVRADSFLECRRSMRVPSRNRTPRHLQEFTPGGASSLGDPRIAALPRQTILPHGS